MEEGKRQKQVAGLLNEELNEIFQRLGISMVDGGMVSIAGVKVTPDLLEARIYLSFFKVNNPQTALAHIESKAWEVKRELTARVGKQLRRMPEIKYYIDDTLDHVFKMEELFKKIKEEDSNKKEDQQ